MCPFPSIPPPFAPPSHPPTPTHHPPHPSGKLLVTGHSDGSVVIYDVEKCEVVSRRTRSTTQATPGAPAAPGAPDQVQGVAHLSWVEGEGPDTPRSTYQHQFVYRHMRLFSKPPHAGKGGGGVRGFQCNACRVTGRAREVCGCGAEGEQGRGELLELGWGLLRK